MSEDADSWDGYFDLPAERARKAREERGKRERRSQLTAKQRRHTATRTVQFNFRTTQEDKEKADRLKAKLGCSLPDLISILLDHYERTGDVNVDAD